MARVTETRSFGNSLYETYPAEEEQSYRWEIGGENISEVGDSRLHRGISQIGIPRDQFAMFISPVLRNGSRYIFSPRHREQSSTLRK